MKEVIARIAELHSHNGERDEEQLEVVFSTIKRIIVEAPAGYGKTKTMVSKIASLVSFGQVPNPKRVLALTFSVNAASKIRKELAEQLPVILSTGSMSPLQVERRVFTTNYHGFCRRVLGLYGYLINPHLKHMNRLRGVDDSRRRELTRLNIGLSGADIDWLVKYGQAAKEAGEELTTDASQGKNRRYLSKNYSSYLRKVREIFLPSGYVPFNAILLLTRELFRQQPGVRDFYRSYFPVIVIDEFQDTNILQWTLLQDLIGRGDEISEDAYLMFFGDSLQRIYGFIGAIQGILQLAQNEYDMHPIKLKTNHRFRDNENLLYLDANIRRNAESPQAPSIETPVSIEVLEADDQEEEALAVLNVIKEKLEQEPDTRIAVLMRIGRTNHNTRRFPDVFDRCLGDGFSYFYALYSDVDDEYIEFHERCLGELQQIITSERAITFRSVRRNLLDNIKNLYLGSSEVFSSLMVLLETFLNYIAKEYTFLTVEERVDLVRDTFESKSLKQYLGHVKANVILSTVHGAKGLEWDYIILPDMERFSFPTYMSLCKLCPFTDTCSIDFERAFSSREFEREFYQELSTFYVAVTRAKRATLFSYSKIGLNANGCDRPNNLSCYLKLKGIEMSLQASSGA
jgi:DNA helicase-2/ATP-dependent DNA helicase PcrA